MVDPKFLAKSTDPLVAATRLDAGVYQIPHFSFEILLACSDGILREGGDEEWYWDSDDVPALPGGTPRYGVCDSVGQFMEKYGDALKADAGSYCLSFTRVAKADQGPTGGWRWHKWGPYVGNGEPTTEYLYHEPKFDEVFVFEVHRRWDDSKGEFERATGEGSYEWSIPTAPDPGRPRRLFVAVEAEVSRLVCIEETPVTSANPSARRLEVEPVRRHSVNVTLDEARWLLATLPKAIEKIEAIWAAASEPAQERPAP